MNRSLLLLFVAFGLACASGLPAGKTQQAQVDPGMFPWRSVELRFEDHSPLAIMYVIGGRELGAYEANTEYWFVNRRLLSRLGRESLQLSVTDQYTIDPPDPDLEMFMADPPGVLELNAAEAVPPIPDRDDVTADPPGVADPPEPDLDSVLADPPGEIDPPDLQMFTQPVYPEGGWGNAWQQDSIEGGALVQGDKQALRLFTDGAGLSRVVWYQVLEQRDAPENITPEGSFSVVGSVRVPDGYVGYSIDLMVQ